LVVTFSYTIADSGGLTATAQVSVTVNGVNDLPVADDDQYNLPENSTLTVGAPGVLANDSDLDGDGLIAVKESDPVTGTLAWAGDGSFVYTPTLNFNGVVTFTYRAHDGQTDSNTAVVTIIVLGFNEAPVATGDDYLIPEDHTLSEAAPGVLGNDDDPDGNQLTAALDEEPAAGSLAFNLDGSFVYTPVLNFNGVVTFTYHANDGLLDSNTAVVTITVTAVNDAPVAMADSYSTTEEITLSVTALEGVLANDEDVEGDLLTAVLVSEPVSGTVLLRPDGSFVYTPTTGFSGVDSFSYQADDGADLSEPVMVTLMVAARPRSYVYLPVALKP